jgi:hypothetical protein
MAMAEPAFLQERGFPLQCTYVRLVQVNDPETGFPRWRITERCENLPNQRIKGIYTCDDHAEQAKSPLALRARAEGGVALFDVT